jgi:hypothetical protein
MQLGGGKSLELNLEGPHSGETVAAVTGDVTRVALAALNLEGALSSRTLSTINEQKETKEIANTPGFFPKQN